MPRRTDSFNQFTADDPSFTQAPQPYQWVEPTRSRPSRRVAMGLGGFAGASSAGSGGGGGRAVSSTQRKAMTGDEFVNRWRHSEERAWRLQQQHEGSQAWSGSPQDVEDLVGPERSGGMETVVGKRPTPSPTWRDPEGTAGVRVPAQPSGNGNGNGQSGGAARPVPTGVSF